MILSDIEALPVDDNPRILYASDTEKYIVPAGLAGASRVPIGSSDVTQATIVAALTDMAAFRTSIGLPALYQQKIPPVFAAPNATGSVTFNIANGHHQKALVTGNVTLMPPTGGVENATLRLWLTASGGDRDLALNAGVKLPSDTGLTFPKVLESGKLYIVLLTYTSFWTFDTIIGGFE